MTRSGVLPKVIRKELKAVNPDNCTSAHTIYNQRVKLKKQLRHNMMVMQEVFHQARKSDVFLRYTHINKVVENLFWAGKKSLMLASKFLYGLIMDCTYKTNFYKFPLLQIVGISSTKLTFSIAFAYLRVEKKENFEWALRALREALVDKINLTQVIITDRELALMDAIQTVLPCTTHLLCRWHIEKAIKAHIRRGMSDLECDEIISAWKKIVYSESNEQHKFALEECKGMVSNDIFTYVESTLVTPYKERFISMWTNRVFHLGNTETSRVEGAHAALKNWLGTAHCDMATGWDAVTSLCDQQYSGIEDSFEISKMKWPTTTFGGSWCRYLRGVVSLEGLHLIKEEFDRSKSVGVDKDQCDYLLRYTHGLPCAHEISEFMGVRDSLPRTCVQEHWKILSMEDKVPLNDEDLDPQPHINAYIKMFDSSSKLQ